jgi:hypothetical protein
MRRPLSYLIAATMLAVTTASSIVPTEAASRAPSAANDSGLELVGDRGRWNNDGWRGDNWREDRWRHEHHHHRRDGFVPGFGFGFGFGAPFAYAPRYYAPQPDCFQDGYGRLYCRSY